MTAKLVITGRLPGLNEYISAERQHRQRAAKIKRDAQALVTWHIKSQLRGVRFTKPVTMRYLWVERDKRRDKDNISSFGRKVIQDALVDSKVPANDNWACIDGFTDSYAVDKKARESLSPSRKGNKHEKHHIRRVFSI